MKIKSSMLMSDLIHYNYLLLPLLYRFDIPLGFGDRTIEEVCMANNVNVDFFTEIVNSFQNPEYFPKDQLQSFPAKDIISYLKKTHEYYMDIKVPYIENQLKELTDGCSPENKKNLELVWNFFEEYKKELQNHILREESRVLPYILDIDQALYNKEVNQQLVIKIKEYSINDYADEHDNVEDKLFDLKNIIIKYLPAVRNRILCQDILMEIFRLENDLNDHSRIEDKVLIPKVRRMEQEILILAAQ